MPEQNFANHVKLVPTFHFFVIPVLTLNFVSSIFKLVHTWFRWDALIGMLTAAALVVLAFRARLFALSVQDRVIRLEERMRFERLLPDDLKARIAEFQPGQLVALRFACDAELPALARKVLNDNLTDRKAIKKMVQTWRPDYLRA
ncbi:MAG TPA: DUF6526 family protein [Candidatus Sulfotelmatobacter sp.]|jgi:Family of unknown function (DUF6526)|nr:DUF6526 family protein [Candidatus Sulfotelmatobacter sp.]